MLTMKEFSMSSEGLKRRSASTQALYARVTSSPRFENGLAHIIASAEPDSRSKVPPNLHPHEFLIEKLRKRGIGVKVCDFHELALAGFFAEPTEEEIEAYTLEVIDAVRTSNITFLRQHQSAGKPLKCSNRFGESLLHLAARKELIDVVKFLLDDAGVCLRVCDDYGRTPLHDACWSTVPNFALVDVILDKCPDLLYIKDKRGHSPLFYARQNHWPAWIEHLEKRLDTLSPKCHLFQALDSMVCEPSSLPK